MEPGMKTRTVPSSNTPNPSCPRAASFTPPNPYARDPSRRAIACVTCAKAKTRCDKALPSCSRCISKGIKCDPRSTRRTSDNNYRTLPSKKPFVTPKRFTTPGILPSSTAFPSARSNPSSRPRSIMRAPSHIDFRTAVKMSQQAAIISGVPKLTPLPTYQSQIVDECYSYTSTPEPELRYTPEIEQDSFPFSRGGTPQTPSEPFGCNQSLPVIDDIGYLDCSTWSAEGLVPVGLGFTDLDMPLASDWMTPAREPEEMAAANLFAQTQAQTQALTTDLTSSSLPLHDFDPLSTVHDTWSFSLPTHQDVVPSSKAMDGGMDSGIVMQTEWPQQPQPQPQQTRQDLFVDMSLVTSAPYVPKMQGLPGVTPVWEDVFMPGALAY
ncbi:hypothetical protein SVAN01_04878 [Stagonosporopsis vannaccii]|nr:hypothetical protein SVAN01_04878 [Stagonosporopsis vannaccii]